MADSKLRKAEETAVAEESKSKQQKRNEDRISRLSDRFLIRILSLLPTKTSVQTSILSRRWRNLWKQLLVLNFSDEDIINIDSERSKKLRSIKSGRLKKFNSGRIKHKFIQNHCERFKRFEMVFLFLTGFLCGHGSINKIQKMRLSLTKSLTDNILCTSTVNFWIRSAMRPVTQELDLTLYTIDASFFQIPTEISNCTSLVSLSLEGALCIDLQQAESFNLPSLKKLRLNIRGMNVTSLNIFLNGCTCLENLDLYFNAEDYTRIFTPSLCLENLDLNAEDYTRISTPSLCVPPSLNMLKITVYNSDLGTSLETQVLHLEHISISTSDVDSNACNLQNVGEASLDVSNASAFTLIQLLQALSGIKHLVLSPSATKLLLGCVADLHFPNFCHLLHLELILPRFSSDSLLSLLQKCHLLQVLIIQNDNEVCNDMEVCNDTEEQSPLPKWATLPSVPSCLESHLSYIQFKGYRGFPDELLLAEYILQKGLVLKTMIIVDISPDLKEKFNTLKRLSDVPRASGMCQLTVD